MEDDMNEVDVVKAEAMTLPERAAAIGAIKSHDQYAQAGSLLLAIKSMRKRVADAFGPIVRAAYEAHKVAKGKMTEAEAPLDVAESTVKRLMVAYDQEQERLRQEAQRAAEEAARKAEEDRMLAEAEALAKGGETAAAEAVLESPVVAPPVIVAKSTPKVEGIQYREQWTYQVFDMSAVPREYLTLDEKKVGAVVRAMKGMTNIPGIRAISERVIAAGAR